MSDLVERYVHQVGRDLPRAERSDIEAELRSQIHDQLDDRFGPEPTPAEIAAVLRDLGAPRRLAASYNRDQYLIGPALYPTMMMVLRHGWLLVPAIVLFLHVFGLVIAPQPVSLTRLLLEPAWAALQAALIFSAVVVLIFALIQRLGGTGEPNAEAFNPTDLPEVDDPRSVERLAVTFSIAFGIVVMLLLAYFLSVGGLTLRFIPGNPGEVIPAPTGWMLVLLASGVGLILVHLAALHRNHWTMASWLLQAVLQMVGVVSLYFVLWRPLFERLVQSNPALGDVSLAEIIVVISGILTVLNEGSHLVKLWTYSPAEPLPNAPNTSP
jgi:hypothetical protein